MEVEDNADEDDEVLRLRRNIRLANARAKKSKIGRLRDVRSTLLQTGQILSLAKSRRISVRLETKKNVAPQDWRGMKEMKRKRASMTKRLVKFTKSAGRGRRFDDADDLLVAFSTSKHTTETARRFNCKKLSVRQAQTSVCVSMESELDREFREWENTEFGRPLAAFHIRKFDTAKSRLRSAICLPVIGDLLPQQTSQVTNVFVTSRSLVVVYESGLIERPIPCLTIPTSSTNASSVRNCTDKCPQIEKLQTGVEKILKKSVIAGEIDCVDGAYSNRKYEAWREGLVGDDVPAHSSVICGNHSNHLTDQNAEGLLAKREIKYLTAMCSLFRTCNYFLRFLSVVYVVTLENLDVQETFAPTTSELWELREEHMMFFFHSYERAYNEEAYGDHDEARIQYAKLWKEFRCWWNGPVNIKDRVPHCTRSSGVNPRQREKIATNLASSFANLHFKNIPAKPECGKWTKTPPTVSWFTNLVLCGMMLNGCVQEAYKNIKIGVVDADQDTKTLSFEQMTGVRLQSTKELAADGDAHFNLCVLDICFIPTRYLTAFFLKTTRNWRDPCKTLPSRDLIWPVTSVATVCLQFLSYLLMPTARHLRILWEPSGHPDYAAFAEDQLEKARRVRVCFYMTSVSIYRRQVEIWQDGLHLLVCVGDVRRPACERQEAYDRLMEKRRCCVNAVVWDILVVLRRQREGFIWTIAGLRIMEGVAYAMARALSVADIERKHHRNKVIIRHDTLFSSFASKAFLEDIRVVTTATAKTMHRITRAFGICDAPPENHAPLENQQTKRKISGMDMFLEDEKAIIRVEGGDLKSLCFSKEGRGRLVEKWTGLSVQGREEYRIMADLANRRRVDAPAIADRAPVAVPALPLALPDRGQGVVVAQAGSTQMMIPCGPCDPLVVMSTCKCCNDKDPRRHSASLPPVSAMCLYVPPEQESVHDDDDDHAGERVLDIAKFGGVSSFTDIKTANEVPFHIEKYKCAKKNAVKQNAESGMHVVFSKKASHVCIDDDHVPKKVNYPKLCLGDLCQTATSSSIKLLQRRFLQTLEDLVSKLCKIHKCKPLFLSMHEYMIVITVKRGDVTSVEFLGQLALANARSGPNLAFQGFVEFVFQSAEAHGRWPEHFAGELVQLRRLDYVESSRSSAKRYLNPHGFGAVSTVSMNDLVMKIRSPLVKLTVRPRLEITYTLLDHTIARHGDTDRIIVGINNVWGPTTIGDTVVPPPPLAIHQVEDSDDDFSVLPADVVAPPPPPRAGPVPAALLDAIAEECGEDADELVFEGDEEVDDDDAFREDSDGDGYTDSDHDELPADMPELPPGLVVPPSTPPTLTQWELAHHAAGYAQLFLSARNVRRFVLKLRVDKIVSWHPPFWGACATV